MNEKTKKYYLETREYFNKQTTQLQALEADTVSVEDCVDAIYAIREAEELIDDVKKTYSSLSRKLQEAVHLILLSRHKKSFSTDFCTGTRKSKVIYGLPTKRKEPKKFASLMAKLGIPEDLVDKEVIRPHWPGLVEYFQELNTQGLPQPEEVDTTKQSATLEITIRRKKGILE